MHEKLWDNFNYNLYAISSVSVIILAIGFPVVPKYIIFIYPTIGTFQSITSDIFAITLHLLRYMESSYHQ